jgi:uncharacterized protein
MRIGVLLVPLFLWTAAAAQVVTEKNAPALSGMVVDEANILSPQTEALLTTKLRSWQQQSSDQVVVATIPDLRGADIETYSYQLGRVWGIGVGEDEEGRRLDNGVLLVIAPNEREVRIDVGYGLEPSLTDAKTSLIIQNGILPAFREGDFDAGAIRGVEGIIGVLSGDEAEWMERRQRAGERPVAEGEGSFPWPLLIFVLLFVVPRFFGSRRRGGIVYDSDRRRRRRYGDPGADALAWIIASQLAGGGRSGGSSFGGGGGFGGGFSGGGGSFGGGGASGSW